MDRRALLKNGALAGAGMLAAWRGWPVGRVEAAGTDQLRVLAEVAPNSLDPQGEGVSAASLSTFANVYDRLINFGRREVAPGVWFYDYHQFTGELAESFEEQDDGRVLLFHLRRDARFHDGTPVTAGDVKWSFDRAVALPASRRQFATGSLTDPAQFTALDDHSFKITFDRRDRYTLPNLALNFASVINAGLAKAHATADDPWATKWLRDNAAGGGAYRVESWNPAEAVIYSRFEDWQGGPLPQIRRAIVRIVPAATARAATVEKGDGDIALQLPPRDIDAIAGRGAVKVVSLPVTNTFRFIAFNNQQQPFDDLKVRRAIALALPYDDLFKGAVFGHGKPLWGAPAGAPTSPAFPQAGPHHTDLAAARALLAEAGYPQGFATSFSYNANDATIGEPVALLVQEALGRIGIRVTLDKVPAAQWGGLLTEHKIPFYVEGSSAWFNDPDYFFRIFFQGEWRWNFSNFKNPDLNALVEAARWESDPARYEALMKQAVAIIFDQVPLILLWQPSFDLAMAPDLSGFTYYIHGQVDFRPLKRG